MAKTAVLAFSGGLDTSYCAKYYSKEKGYNVHSVIINTGGFSPEELANIETKAKNLGVSKHVCIDISQDYYKKCIRCYCCQEMCPAKAIEVYRSPLNRLLGGK